MADSELQESEREQASPILPRQSEYDENTSFQRSGYGDLPHITSNRSQSRSRAEPEERLAHALGWLSIGVGLAAAILIDATVIRLVVLPAALVLLGDRAWWPSMPKPAASLPPAEQPDDLRQQVLVAARR